MSGGALDALAWGAPGLLALGLAVALWLAASDLRLWPEGRGPRIGVAALLTLAAAVRLVFVPAWWAHRYDGHEAEYYAIFLGERGLGEASTRLYPAMQALWALVGHVAPRVPQVPVLLSVGIGLAGGLCLARAAGWLFGFRAGWIVAVLLAVHPAAAAWAGSAYNVIAPNALLTLALAAIAAVEVRSQAAVRLAWVAGMAFGLAVACRVEVAVFGVTLLGLALVSSAGFGRLALPLLGGAVLGALATAPLLVGGAPGDGEREVALNMNLLWFDPYGAWGSGAGLVLLGLAALLACWRSPRRAWPLLLGVVAIHVTMAGFDDFGERHALLALPGLALLLAAGGLSFGWRTLWLPLLALGFLVPDLVSLRWRYEGSEQSFAALVRRGPYAELPVWTLRRPAMSGRSPVNPNCGWISEDERVSTPPLSSHFNLWDSAEAESLRGAGDCLHWCLDAGDWRWDSRSVRDRAMRVAHLYEITPIAVVEEPSSGYACLVMEIGPRRCCGPDLTPFALRPSGLAAIP